MSSKQLNYLNATYQNIVKNFPGYAFWKNTESIYLGCNQNLADLLGLSTTLDIVGKLDSDFVGKIEALSFQQDDIYVIQTGNMHISEYLIPIKNRNNLNMLIRTEKRPLLNENGKVIGIIGMAIDITDGLSNVFNFLHQKLAIKNTNIDLTIKLTKREYEVLYLLLLGKSPKEIALILSNIEDKVIAPATINSIINKSLYLKFKVNSYSQLIAKSIISRSVNLIPSAFLKNQYRPRTA